MKNGRLLLRASISAALATVPVWAVASGVGQSNEVNALAGIDTSETPRVTQTVDTNVVSSLAHTHLAFLPKLTPAGTLADSTPMKHMQLVLQPSAARKAQLASLISQQHDPSSPRFHQWLTPAQYGEAFGVLDSDVEAAKAWLISEGFTVNGVYPNKTQIDFSGTAGQIRQAFHTQEAYYTIRDEKQLANTTDISVPTALQPVIAGVLGLNSVRPQPMHEPAKKGTYSVSTHRFALPKSSNEKTIPYAVALPGGVRGLVPNDFANMYGIVGAPGENIRANGVTGKGITIAVVEDYSMHAADWTNFVNQFNLAQYGGTFTQFQPNVAGLTNCYSLTQVYGFDDWDDLETVLDAEYTTAMAPGANIEVAQCTDVTPDRSYASSNTFGGVFIAASNLVNSASRPDIISASYGLGETLVDSASKQAIDSMWAQADAEGISVFVSSGDSGSNPSFNGGFIYGAGIDANAFATSPNVTAVGGTDTADILDGTTSEYFNTTPNVAYGTAKGYVPEIPWNQSCGNGVAAQAYGFASAVSFCQEWLKHDPIGWYATSEAASGGPSSVDAKPAWQREVAGAVTDQSRDVPDASLFAASYGGDTLAVICTAYYPCTPQFTSQTDLIGGTSLAAPMMAGIQALVDQGVAMRGLPTDQGNAAPTLYALAEQEYGNGSGTPPSTLAVCNADHGSNDDGCVFHNVTRGSISTNCVDYSLEYPGFVPPTPDCYFYGSYASGSAAIPVGLTSTDATVYNPTTKAYGAHAGWSFASGLGSVNTRNLLIAWRSFVHAPSASQH